MRELIEPFYRTYDPAFRSWQPGHVCEAAMSGSESPTPFHAGASLRRRSLYALFLAGSNFIGFAFLTVNVSHAFGWLMVLIPLGAGLYLLSLRCPRCGTPIYKRKATVAGIELTYWGGWIPRRCSSCSAEIP